MVIAASGMIAASLSSFSPPMNATEHINGVAAYTVFNTPNNDGTPDYAIESHLISLINDTPAGAQIHGAMFSWTRETIAKALSDAQARGVKVSLAIDRGGSGGTTNTDPDNTAIQKLKDAKLTKLVFCTGTGGREDQQTACIADRDYSINHNKLFSFSSTGDLSNVVVSASQNMTNSQGSLFNNAVVMHSDKPLYDFFGRHFENLLAQKKNNDYFNSNDGYYRSDDKSVTVYFSPRADSSGGNSTQPATDTVNLILGYIKDQSGDCALNIVEAEFTDPRIAVADQISRIAGLGCKVKVVYGKMDDAVYSKLSSAKNIELKRFFYQPDGYEDPVSVHSKYIQFNGTYNGTDNRKLLFSGSQNLTGPSLRNHDETLTKVENAAVFSGFTTNFDQVWSQAKCENPSSGKCP